jgi:predicted pyridoxine 5'-phosphate oxidase superfamily flavin-nucleotide-binding protein
MITPDMRAVIEVSQLCFAATVSSDGRPNLSPAYWRGLDEHAIRAQWRERRAALDREFETYLARVGPVRITDPSG